MHDSHSHSNNDMLLIASLTNLLTHFRFLLTLRSQNGRYHSLILFRLSESSVDNDTRRDLPQDASNHPGVINHHQMYAMESTCPHLGADLSHADIETYEESIVAVCPWHRYDFDLRTGKSEMGLKACTYAVEVRKDGPDETENVYIKTPDSSTNWLLVELRPVSEEFADPPAKPIEFVTDPTGDDAPSIDEPIVPETNPPKTLMQWAVLILNTANPTLKVDRTRHAVNLFRTGKLISIGNKSSNAPDPPDVPPREESFSKNLVNPAKVKNRKNRAVMLHALANIEQWAIDLAWDIMARFGPTHPDLPPSFFSDFTKIALDESKHFSLLTARLAEISPSTPYGTMPVHASLWESASSTSHSLRARLAIIHLVHEARGLDINPATIERFKKAGDEETVRIMEIIHADEVTHVTAGHRWFTWFCSQQGQEVDPVAAFREEVRKGWRGDVKGPFNVKDREKAGMTRDFYEGLKGEMGIEKGPGSTSKNPINRDNFGTVQIGYEE